MDVEDEKKIKQLARRLDTNESELIRQAIREFLRKDPERNRSPLDSLVGQSELELTDGSTDHDRLLNESRMRDLSE